MNRVEPAAVHKLTTIDLIAVLPPARQEELVRLCQWRRYDKDEQIIDRASVSANRDVMFIASGAVRVVVYSLMGRDLTLDDRRAGTYFGELAAIDGQPRSASAMAVEPTLIAALPAEHFVRFLATEPSFARIVMLRLATMVRTTTDRLIDLSTLGANHRVHVEILRLAQKAVNISGVPAIKPIPIHGELAARVSTTRETVARVLGDLARRKILTREADALMVTDLGRLQDMVDDVRGE
jgi:CRP-like cAMP-binding protein